MNHFWTIMSAPFVECLILVGLHSYLGLHVLRRHVIFVDLSLAQIAALGTTVGIVFGIYDTESPASFLFALSFTVLGAAIFALSRFRDGRIPQEAFIGLVYAITAAVAVLVVEKTKGVEELVNIMHGRLLWVRWGEVGLAAVAYAILGAIHFVFRKQFLFISDHPDQAYAQGMNVRAWDFFFYVTFGFTISISVKVAGVLLVFVFLVAPAIIALLLSRNIRTQLFIGWATGFLVTVVGMSLSWWADMPTGPMVVAFYGVVLLAVALVVYLVRAENRALALRNLGIGAAVLAVAAVLFWFSGHLLAGSVLAGHKDADMMAELAHEGHALGADADVDEPEPVGLSERFEGADTPFDQLELVQQALREDEDLGLQLLLTLLRDPETPPFCCDNARTLLLEHAGQDFGYDATKDDNAASLQAFADWLAQRDGAAVE
ncbi:MAG: iron chelate uptake ABC transporter family permease subunit [Pseudomonadota bacterium]